MSTYISIADYNGIIKDTYLEQITANNPSLLDDVEAMAMDEVKMYLPKIDFTTNTDKSLKMRVMDIALYHIHSRLPVKEIPQIRIDRYEQAIAWLEKIATGTIGSTQVDSQRITSLYGSLEKQNFHF